MMIMGGPWDLELLSRMSDGCLSFLAEFAEDWLSGDARVAIFKVLLAWLVCSSAAVHFAWRAYGDTVNDMYYRQGAGRNGGTPDAAPRPSGREAGAGDVPKTRRD